MTDESLWHAADVATFLKTSRSLIYAMAADGRMPCRRVGALLRFVPSEIRAWVENGAATPSVRAAAHRRMKQ